MCTMVHISGGRPGLVFPSLVPGKCNSKIQSECCINGCISDFNSVFANILMVLPITNFKM